MKVFRHPGYLNRVGMASSDTMRKILHLLRSDMWLVYCLVPCSPTRNTKHLLFAVHFQASSMCHRFDFVEGAGQLFLRWLNPVSKCGSTLVTVRFLVRTKQLN